MLIDAQIAAAPAFLGHIHRLSKNASYELRNCGGCRRFVQGMTEIEAERGGKCKMQPKLLLIAALLSWASISVTSGHKVDPKGMPLSD